MTDFEYDALQMKRIARGAQHMKRGSRSRRCSLPSDHLTAAQLKGRNGPVSTYNLEKPMSWEAFKQMPLDLQQTYIASLQSRFAVGVATISKELFGLSAVALRQYMLRHGLALDAAFKGTRPDVHWNRWLAEDTAEPAVGPDEELTHVEAEAEIREVEGTDKKNIDGFDMNRLIVDFTGEFAPESFLRYLSRFPMPQGRVRIRMEVTVE